MDSPRSILAPAFGPNSALALIPPKAALAYIQPLRSLYDPAVTKWVPHINIFYPFVDPVSLLEASRLINKYILDGVEIEFDRAEVWRNGTLVVLRPSEESERRFRETYNELLLNFPAFGQVHAKREFKMHLTIGEADTDAMGLVAKALKMAASLGRTTWNLAEMKRDKETKKMEVVHVFGHNTLWTPKFREVWKNDPELLVSPESVRGAVTAQDTFEYGTETGMWGPAILSPQTTPQNLTLSTYNCLYIPGSTKDTRRMQEIARNIMETRSSVICLQEVWDELLDYLLNHSKVGERFLYVSHSPQTTLPRNQTTVILSEIEFEWEQLTLTKFKTVALASFGDLVVANIHAPAGLSSDKVAQKDKYFSGLRSYLEKHIGKACLIVGDFNLPTDADCQDCLDRGDIVEKDIAILNTLLPKEDFQDAWTLLEPEEYGATFDPIDNDLAMQSMDATRSRLPRSHKRYDRLLFTTSGPEIVVRDVGRFGFRRSNGTIGSDHYGLTVALKFGSDELVLSEEMLSIPALALKDEDLVEYLHDENALPTASDARIRDDAIDALTRCLRGHDEASAPQGQFQMELTPVGSYGLGTWSMGSDIDCLAVGNISSKIFWKIAKQQVKRWTECEMRIVRFVNANIPMMILVVNGVQVDLQYCAALRVVENWSSIATLQSDDPLFNLPVTTLRKLQAYRDMNHLLATIPNLAHFRTAYRLIKLWAVKRGIYSSKFGYIGGVHITLLLSRACLLLPSTASVAQILKTFLSQYAAWDWTKDVWQPNMPKKIRYLRSAREKMAILTIHAPAVNVALNATKHTVAILRSEFTRANERVERGWEAVCGVESVESEFLASYARYIKVEVQFWGAAKSKGRGLVGWVESRCVMLLAELATKVPTINARIWPTRFHEVSTPTDDNNEELRGFYLIGLKTSSVDDAAFTKDQKRSIEATFNDTLRTFEDTIKNPYDGKFDEKEMWVQVSCVKSLKPSPNTIIEADDTGFWETGLGATAEEYEDSDSEDDDADDDEANPVAGIFLPKAQKSNEPTPKLRPSHEILSRIRWDPNYDSSDFVVGYEDRFRGVLEMPVDNWRIDMSDEEFVPMHRIVWFRKRSDGEKVWDRAGKVDKIFGSGVSGVTV